MWMPMAGLGDLALRKVLKRSRKRSAHLELNLGHHLLSWNGELEQSVSMVGSAVGAERVWDSPRVAMDGRVSMEWGTMDETFVGQQDSFWILSTQASVWTPVDLPLIPGLQKLRFSINSQLTDSQLPSTRRMALGGVAGAGAFERGYWIADSGAVAELMLQVPVRLGDLRLFVDTGIGESHNEFDQRWGHLTSLGVGWDVSFEPGIGSRLSWAMPLNARGEGGLDDDGPRIYWSLTLAR